MGRSSPHQPVIGIERGDGILTITLARAEAKNAIDLGIVRRLRDALAIAREDDGVRVVVLRSGVPGYFSIGMDLDALAVRVRAGATAAEFADLAREYIELLVDLVTLRCPTVAGVGGVAVGGGVDITAACDIAIAGEGATFSIAMLRKGIFPITTSAVVAPRIGERAFFHWLATGIYHGAKKALRLGLLSEVVAAARLEARLVDVATRLAGYDEAAVRLGMEALRLGSGSATADRLRRLAPLLAQNMRTPKSWIDGP